MRFTTAARGASLLVLVSLVIGVTGCGEIAGAECAGNRCADPVPGGSMLQEPGPSNPGAGGGGAYKPVAPVAAEEGSTRTTFESTCGTSKFTSYVAPSTGTPELVVLGIYQSHPTGVVTVTITKKSPIVLALSSYEPTSWKVVASEDANIVGVVVNGYYTQRATAPAGVPVETYDAEHGLGQFPHAWPTGADRANWPGLVSVLEATTNTTFGAFGGCYTGDAFVVSGE